jgi:FAD:protein FMN transferase
MMGQPVSVHLRGEKVRTAAIAERVEEVFDELRTVETLFNPRHPDSELNRLNRGEIPLADCDPRVREVAVLCDAASYRSRGYFDAHLPDLSGVRRHNPVTLVRGWALDSAANRLIDLADLDLFLNAGGDLIVHSATGENPLWRVGVGNPADPTALLAVLPLAGGAMARVSGPRKDAATVVGPSLLWSTVYAAATLARADEACRNRPQPALSADGGTQWLDTVDGYEGIVVDRDGHLHTTADLTIH